MLFNFFDGPGEDLNPLNNQNAFLCMYNIVNDINKLTFTMCHCERSEAISRDCHVPRIKYGVLAMTIFQGRSI